MNMQNFNPFKIGVYIAAAVITLILVLSYWPLKSVPTGSRGVVTVGGAIRAIEEEGFAMLWPWEKLDLFNIRAEMSGAKNAEGGTSDQQPVYTDLTVRYSIVPDKVSYVFEHYSHNGDLSDLVFTATAEAFKAVTAKYTAPELIQKRSQVSLEISNALQTKLNKYGAQVINIDMTRFAFSDSYMKAINEKATQEQLRQAAENKVKTVEAEQQQNVAIAKAEAESQRARADGQAYATLKEATAQADSLKIQNQALAQNKDVLELRRIEVEMVKAQNWKGELPTAIYGSAPIPFINVK